MGCRTVAPQSQDFFRFSGLFYGHQNSALSKTRCVLTCLVQMTDALAEPTADIQATVLVLVAEFGLAKVQGDDGRHYSVTRHTAGVRVADLQEGQRLQCTVTLKLPRVLHAKVI